MDGAPVLQADVVIIGGGVAGITMALELERGGIDTILLESGGESPDEATRDLNRGTSTELPYRFADGSRCRFLGGSSNCWGGWCRPFDRWDFERRPWVAHSGWPLAATDLAPYYPRTHDYLDLGSFDYDLRRVVAAVGRRDVADLPVRRDVVPPRSPVSRHRRSSASSTAMRSPAAAMYAPSSTRMRSPWRTPPTVGPSPPFVVAPSGAARSWPLGGLVVLAAGGIENPRLLLASNGVRPAGIGNERDLVGRFFMDHPRILSATVRFHGRWADNVLFDAKFHDRNDQVKAGNTHVAGAMSLPFAVQEREQIANARVWFSSMFPGDHTPAADAVLRTIQRREQRVPPELTLRHDAATMMRHPVSSAGFALTRRHRPRWLIRGVKLQAIVEPEPDPARRRPRRPRPRRARRAASAGRVETVRARAADLRPDHGARGRRAVACRYRQRRPRPAARGRRRVAVHPASPRHLAPHGHNTDGDVTSDGRRRPRRSCLRRREPLRRGELGVPDRVGELPDPDDLCDGDPHRGASHGPTPGSPSELACTDSRSRRRAIGGLAILRTTKR